MYTVIAHWHGGGYQRFTNIVVKPRIIDGGIMEIEKRNGDKIYIPMRNVRYTQVIDG